jgi:hypothetical protein
MKKLFFIFAVAVSPVVNAQLKIYGTPIYYNESDFLKKYNLDSYMPVYQRYVINDTLLFNQCSKETQTFLNRQYKQFVKWNSDTLFMNKPDTVSDLYGNEFLFQTNLHLNNNLTYVRFNFNNGTQYTKILGYKKFYIGRDNIKSITIVEYFDIFDTISTTLAFEFIIEYVDGTVKLFDELK